MEESLTKEYIYDLISNASTLGTLGLFIGSGFTKAVLENSDYTAYSWGELLAECCRKMRIDKEIMNSFASYPEIASKICNQFAEENKVSYQEAKVKLKEIIGQLTTVMPNIDVQTTYESFFESLNVNWIATTNYDTTIESIISWKALGIEPSDCYLNIKGLIPVYHLHGICNNPESIIITNEDYTLLFRPNDYRQARLPFLMKESLVLMLGYKLGDINVLTAVDWSNNVYTNSNPDYNFPIIQLLYTERPKVEPYKDESGIIIIEINNLKDFFIDLCSYVDKAKKRIDKKIERINGYISDFTEANNETINRFINNEGFYRTNFTKFIASLTREFGYIYKSYYAFLRIVMQELNEQSTANCAFHVYDKKLNIILDAFENMPFTRTPKSFFYMLAEEFNSLIYYIGRHMGQSYAAADTWDKRKNALPKEILTKLIQLAEADTDHFNEMKMFLRDCI